MTMAGADVLWIDFEHVVGAPMALNPNLADQNPLGMVSAHRKSDVLPHFTKGEKVSSRRPFKRGTG